ncbi:MAG: hypothetical protein SAL07_03945 [Oscillatoria sp. PMC 1051.18]|nr:hypothetical protein [Oscillatoria sp. PMC 1050.18]MEC5029042.1 hypothetical protein [Oscillatoria sp. PMC 1051.18]
MEELIKLKQFLSQGEVDEALLVVEELAEMSKSEKINQNFNFSRYLRSRRNRSNDKS